MKQRYNYEYRSNIFVNMSTGLALKVGVRTLILTKCGILGAQANLREYMTIISINTKTLLQYNFIRKQANNNLLNLINLN